MSDTKLNLERLVLDLYARSLAQDAVIKALMMDTCDAPHCRRRIDECLSEAVATASIAASCGQIPRGISDLVTEMTGEYTAILDERIQWEKDNPVEED
ncbi:hypothetical protein [Frateuria aurantia]|uniref:hypothetical protein n=1 Tax=Frateuria aurantia TaxID=81475 RepID=UPI00059CD7E6|nr:hypothetical protein [Frateuria aurantia]